MKTRYLSKSRFKEGLDCLTKLYYSGKPGEYADQAMDDPFLLALADGGHQVGKLALYLFSEDPVTEGIEVDGQSEEEVIKITQQRLARPDDRVVLAEAAFRHGHLFIRADIIVREPGLIKLYEVKSKSISITDEGVMAGEDQVKDSSVFYAHQGRPKERISSAWAPYLYDVAFQHHVISRAYPKHEVQAHLVLANTSARASIDGLNQLFQLEKQGKRTRVAVPPGLRADHLGDPILSVVGVEEEVQKILHTYPVPTPMAGEMGFGEFVSLCESICVDNQRVQAPLTTRCKHCQYHAKEGSRLKDGRKECLAQVSGLKMEALDQPMAYELWRGGRRVDSMLQNGVFLLKDMDTEALRPKKQSDHSGMGLDDYQRKEIQIQKVREKNPGSYFDRAGFKAESAHWGWPRHMIDFETSQVALPFFKNTSPYQGHAFQFSHHVMHADGRIEHANQFIHFEKNQFPNLAFVRSLMRCLSTDDGPVFRYHNHENTYLRLIHDQICSGELRVDDAQEKQMILAFVDQITRYRSGHGRGDYVEGPRAMIDLYQVIKRYYYPPSSGGRIGLKHILPAIIKDSAYLQNKYGRKGVYGKDLPVRSLNFADHQWINPGFELDPYQTLPPVSGGDLEINMPGAMLQVADGGAALTAYNYLQYTHVPEEIKLRYRDALLRYCELDTMAMVFILEGLMQM